MRSFVFAAMLLLAIASAKKLRGSVREVDGVWEFTPVIDKTYAAYGSFKPMMNVTGWGILRLETNPDYSNEIQSYAAGFLEGILTEWDIYVISTNIYTDKEPTDLIKGLLEENAEWEKKEAETSTDKRYWNHRKYLDLQMDGIYDGYMYANKDKPERHLTKWQILYSNNNCDVDDWAAIHNQTSTAPYPVDHRDHCSALIRMPDDRSDLFMGHNTWFHLHTMHRIYKIYDIKLKEENGELIPGHLQTFSSYPATINSSDDYYTMDNHLVVIETTIENYNPDLYKYQTPQAVMQWARNLIANRLAVSPKNWCELYAMYNNGCYANEWMVIDFDAFVPGYGLKKDGFWMIEQLPGYVHMEDMTDYFNNKGFFPSYNVAYFPDIYEMGGTRKKWEELGDDYSYEKCPRARQFAREAPKVQDFSSYRATLRYNDFRHDPISKCEGYPGYCGSYAIAARYDLNLKNGTYPRPSLGLKNHAAIDAKFTSVKMLKEKHASQIISGPAYKNVGAFEWETSAFKDAPHWCMPPKYEFPWIEVNSDAAVKLVGWEYDD